MSFHLQQHHLMSLDFFNLKAALMQSNRQAHIDMQEAFKASNMALVRAQSIKQWIKLTHIACYFLAKDMLPYDMVIETGFRHMVQAFV